MKKYLILIAVIIVLSTMVSGCVKDIVAKRLDAFQEAIIDGDFVCDGDLFTEGAEWVKMWLESVYGDFGLSYIEVEYHRGAVYSCLSDMFEISPYQYVVKLSAEKKLPNIKPISEGKYEFKVIAVAVYKNKQYVLSGILGPNDVNEYDALPVIYGVVSKDQRFIADLKELPEYDLPPEIQRIGLQDIISLRLKGFSTGKMFTSEYILPGGVIASFCREIMDNKDNANYGIALYDMNSRTAIGYVDLGNYNYMSVYDVDDKLRIQAKKESDSNIEYFSFDREGKIVDEEMQYRNLRHSPSGRKYAYSKDGNIVVYSKDNKGSNIVIEGNDSHELDRDYYYPYAWVDDEMLIYGSGGYEWSNGCGIINVVTGEITHFKQAGQWATPITLADGKLFTTIGDMGAPFDPGIIDLHFDTYPYKRVFEEREFILNTYFEDYSISQDGKKVALLEKSSDSCKENKLYICSTEDGSILNTIDFRTPFNSPQYLHFIEEDRLVIFSEEHSFCENYVYIVDVK